MIAGLGFAACEDWSEGIWQAAPSHGRPVPCPRAAHMSFAAEIQAIYDRWDREVRQQALKQGLEQGEERGLRRALAGTYQARFGTVPEPLRAALEATEDEETLLGWVPLFATGSVEDIAAAVLGPGAAPGQPAR